ncbi:MAG: hypothetical protein ACODAC_11515 [Pseudomonadota bacterium]
MRNLIGQIFALADGSYRIVDVQSVGADALVYAERLGSTGGDRPGYPAATSGRPPRAALHYEDVAPLLDRVHAGGEL